MRRSLIVVAGTAALAGLAACGSSSTGPNSNPHPVNHDVQIQSTGFSPETVTVAVEDTVTWMNADDVVHAVIFTGALPPGANPSSGPIAPGAKKSTVFLRDSTYTYRDSTTANTGAVVVQ